MLVNLPLNAALAAGQYFVIVETDALGNQPESDETNNRAVTAAKISLDFPPLPDLQLQNPTVLETSPTSGQPLTIRWSTVNAGSVPVADAFVERIVVFNGTTGSTLLNTTAPFAVSAGDLLEAGESVNREYVLTLPNGPAGAGNLIVTITTDASNRVVESFNGSLPETNNIATTSVISTLPPYPDLKVVNPQVTPASLQTGESFNVSWSVVNAGTAAAAGDFLNRVRLVNRGSGQTLVDVTVPYVVSTSGAIGVGVSRSITHSVRVPDGSGSVGDLDIFITADSANTVFELNGTGDAESNNQAITSAVASLAPYPDLAVSNVVAPVQTIADPANVTVSWKVENVGTLTALSGNWFDAVIASTDEIIGDADDRVVARFERTGSGLAPNGSYSRTETFQLPPAFTGRYYLYVLADVEIDRSSKTADLANNAVRSPDFFDVMPIPYADLVVTSVTSRCDGKERSTAGGQLAS